MKKFYMLLVMLTIAGMGIGQTTLSAGDIAIFGVNADEPDDFGFVLLVDIDAGTEIRFTDSGWKSDNTFRGGEGAVKYTAPTSLSAGTEITYQGNNGDFVADNDATVGNNGFTLSASGDQVFAFQGVSTSPTFIYAVQTNSTVWQSDATNSSTSAIPLGLTDGTNAAAVGSGSGAGAEWDNAAYDKDNSTMSGTAAVLLAAISTNSNWVGQNSPRYDLTLYDFTITTGSTAPTVSTVAASNIYVSTADMNGNVTSNGGDSVTDRGVCYNTSAGVTLSDNLTSTGSGGTGTYSVTVATLSAETHYYFAAYAKNSIDTTLASNELDFWTLSAEPTAHTSTFTASAASATQIDLSFDAASGIGGDGYIILRRDDGTYPDATGVTDATAPGSLSLPSGTSLVTTIDNNSVIAYSDTALSPVTQYNYAIIPYNYNGSNDETYNYKTDGTIPTDNATTPAKPEPTNHVASFATGTSSSSSIPLTWLDNDGTVAADGFLVMINAIDNFTAPVDGTPQADDTDVSDGSGVVNVAHGDEAYTWTNLAQSTQYYFTIYPYTNSGTAIDYKTDGTVPTANATTTTINTDLIISEVSDPADNYEGRFVELYNFGSTDIDLAADNWYLTEEVQTGTILDVQLTGTIASGATYVVAHNSTDFNNAYGIAPNQSDSKINGSGDDSYKLYFDGNHESGSLIDIYGVSGVDGSGTAWEYTDGKAVRKRSVGSPNSTWTASEWVITSPANVVNMTPGQHSNYVTWQGTTDTDWDTKANWDNGFIPDASMDVTIQSATNSPVIGVGSFAYCWNLTVDAAGSLTVASDTTGEGGLYVGGTSTGNVKVNCYTTTGKWHGVAAPVSGQTANALYLNGNPDVWVKYYNESDNTYDYITDLGTSLGTMKGWMIWVDSLEGVLADTTFTFEGSLRSGTVSPTESIVRSQAGADYGYNFVGNPFTSTIDWDDTVGWTKTNLDTAIYTYKNGNWTSYINGTGNNGGTRYIAMNQGFFVQVSDNGSTTGTLTATNDVQANYSADFMKRESATGEYSLVRLEIDAENMSDETVVKLMDNATNGYDGQYDAHKIFSFNPDHPQIFSTANGNMSINTLPVETGAVDMDVTGKAGDMMTINATERTNLEEVWLVDELTGIQTDLTKEGYSFIYDPSVTNRFTLHFSIVNVNEQTETGNLFTIYAANRKANVIIPSGTRANIEIYNLLGQNVASASNRSGLNQFTLHGNQYYIVKVYNNQQVETKKIVIRK